LGLWITLGVVFALLILPVGTFYALFYDGTQSDMEVDADFSKEKFVNNLMVDSLDNTVTNKELELTITQDNLNQLIYASTSFAKEGRFKDYIHNYYIDITDTTYDFYVEVQMPIFKTKICITTILEDYDDPDNHLNDAFTFKIEDVRMGHVNGMTNIAKKILNNYVSADTLETAIQESGLTMSVDFENMKITYKHIDLFKDLKKLLGDDSGESALYFNAVTEFVNNNLFNFNFNDEKAIKASVNLTSLAINDLYCTPIKNLNIPLEDYCTTLKNMLNDGAIDDTHASIIFSYLLLGYADMDDDTKTYLATCDFSSYGIADVTTYTGYPLHHDDDIEKILKDQITPAGIAMGKIGQINEDQINEVIKSTKVVGYSFLLYFKQNNQYKVNYITLDNFYINILNDKMYLNIGLNLNGYETSIVFIATPTDCTNYRLNFSLDKAYFGNYQISDDFEDIFLGIVDEAIDAESWIGLTKESKTLYIDFSSPINNSGYKSLIDAYGTVDIKCIGESLEDNGYLDVIGVAK
jgi:hypothetical protein